MTHGEQAPGAGAAFRRRTGVAAVVSAVLAGTTATATAAAPKNGTASAAAGSGQCRHLGGTLQRDADAVLATGVSGLVAEVQSAHGRTRVRAGVADLSGEGEPVPWNAYFRIGSDTKTFTAVVALQLVGEGRLALTDTVERWLPGTIRGNGNDGRRITVTNLLRHTSGLIDYLAASGGEDDFTSIAYPRTRFRTHTPREHLEAAMSRPPLWLPDSGDPAGERRWGYSNTNYLVAGLLIERVTGNPWAQEVHDRIIAPLGLRHTLIPGTSSYVPQPTAKAYTRFPDALDRLVDTSLSVGGGADGAIISTTRDLGVFLRALMRGRLLRPAQLAAMKETVPAEDWVPAAGVRYGMGIAWRPTASARDGIWFHGGTSLGTVSEGGVTPDGAKAVTSATFTVQADPDRGERQAAATMRLVDNALADDDCRPPATEP